MKFPINNSSIMRTAFLVDGVRTAFGKFKGTLSPVRTDDLAATPIRALLERHDFDPAAIGDLIMGCANQAGEDNRNVARMAGLLAGLPFSVPGETVNRLCASGLSAALTASRVIQCGDADLMLAGGVEHMTRAPWVISKASSAFGQDSKMYDSSFGWRFINPQLKALYGVDPMGQTAENLAELYNIDREDQDAYALRSQMRTKAALNKLAEEITPVSIPVRKSDPILFNKDEFPRGNTSAEGLAALRTAFKENGTVTAGNASGLNDGAAALLLASEEGLKTHGLIPIAKIKSSAVVGVEPRIMGIGPVGASNLALQRAGLSYDDMSVIELNEAFSAQVLACLRNMGIDDDDARVNPNGGAISIGHPLGATGARILMAAARELQRNGGKYGLVTLCVGVGQGFAVVIERC
ncbi:MAG: acetyl-CoA acyltransferase [Limisphaerales bacterium]